MQLEEIQYRKLPQVMWHTIIREKLIFTCNCYQKLFSQSLISRINNDVLVIFFSFLTTIKMSLSSLREYNRNIDYILCQKIRVFQITMLNIILVRQSLKHRLNDKFEIFQKSLISVNCFCESGVAHRFAIFLCSQDVEI